MKKVKVSYDRMGDVLWIDLKPQGPHPGTITVSEEYENDVIVDLDASGNIVGIIVHNLSLYMEG